MLTGRLSAIARRHSLPTLAFIWTLSLFFGTARVQAQTPPDTQHTHQLKSAKTNHEHELVVILPSSYAEQSKRAYPVLYLLDAYWDLPLVKNIYDKLRFDNQIPELILVGLSYSGSSDQYAAKRMMDFAPVRDDLFQTGGNAKDFLGFLKTQAMPLIEKNYRVDAGDRAIAGASLGGLFTLYSLYNEPGLFRRYLAATPAASWGDEYLKQADAEFAKSAKPLDARLYILHSSAEYTPYYEALLRFRKQFEKRAYAGLERKIVEIDEVRHAAINVQALLSGLIWLYEDKRPKGPSGFQALHEEAMKKKK